MDTMIDGMLDAYDRGRLSRRDLIARLSGAAAALAAASGVRGAGGEAAPTFAGRNINHIALTVTNIDRSAAFYKRHLGLTEASRGPSSCFLRCGERGFLALFLGEQAGMDHYCYGIEKYEAGDAVRRLEAAGLEPRRRADRVYFDDPDGLEVQVASTTHGV